MLHLKLIEYGERNPPMWARALRVSSSVAPSMSPLPPSPRAEAGGQAGRGRWAGRQDCQDKGADATAVCVCGGFRGMGSDGSSRGWARGVLGAIEVGIERRGVHRIRRPVRRVSIARNGRSARQPALSMPYLRRCEEQ
jgi:hypothetical protein